MRNSVPWRKQKKFNLICPSMTKADFSYETTEGFTHYFSLECLMRVCESENMCWHAYMCHWMWAQYKVNGWSVCVGGGLR